MSKKTKKQLQLDNQSKFPNNNIGLITPDKLRDFNTDVIDSFLVQDDIVDFQDELDVLDNKINNETLQRNIAINTLTNLLDEEIINRIATDNTITENLSGEIQSRILGDTNLYNMITGLTLTTQLSQLEDVNLVNLEDGNILKYNKLLNKWENVIFGDDIDDKLGIDRESGSTIKYLSQKGTFEDLPDDNLITKINYDDLVTLRDNSELTPGMWYRITDYETTTTQTETRSAGHLFDVIVLALSEDTLSEDAKAIHSERDTNGYFSNSKLSIWKLKYSLDNDINRFVWSDEENGKGVIYQMIDEWNNDLPYDFKNIQFKAYILDKDNIINDNNIYTYTLLRTWLSNNNRMNNKFICKPTFKGTNITWNNETGKDLTADYIELSWMKSHLEPSLYCKVVDYIWSYTFNDMLTITDNSKDASVSTNGNVYGNIISSWVESNKQKLNHNTFIGQTIYNNIIGINNRYNSFTNNVYNNEFGIDMYENILGQNIYNNKKMSTISFYRNFIVNNFTANMIDNTFYGNVIYNGYSSNTTGKGWRNNIIKGAFAYNTIGGEFYYNIIDTKTRYNLIKRNVNHINITATIENTTIENYVQPISNDVMFNLNLNGTTALSSTSKTIFRSTSNALILKYYDGLYEKTYYKTTGTEINWTEVPMYNIESVE